MRNINRDGGNKKRKQKKNESILLLTESQFLETSDKTLSFLYTNLRSKQNHSY